MPMAPTPIVISKRSRNILIGAILLALLAVCWYAPAVPQMVIAGAALAMMLSFPVGLLARMMPRAAAIAVVMLVLIVLAAVAIVVFIPLVINQLSSLVNNAPAMVDELYNQLQRVLNQLWQYGLLDSSPQQTLTQLEANLTSRAQGMAQQALGIILNTATSIFGIMLSLFGIGFVSIYLLADSTRFKSAVIRMFPLIYQDDVAELWHNAGHSLSRYLSGLFVSLTFQGVASTVALFIIGVPYSFLLGFWTAIAAIVPYVGSYIGGVPAVIAALFVSPLAAILTAITYFTINQIDGNLIAPRVQGQAIRVHPLFIFLAVIAGGQIAGLWGALLAVPLLAILRTVIDFLKERLVVEPPAPAAPIPAVPASVTHTAPVIQPTVAVPLPRD